MHRLLLFILDRIPGSLRAALYQLPEGVAVGMMGGSVLVMGMVGIVPGFDFFGDLLARNLKVSAVK